VLVCAATLCAVLSHQSAISEWDTTGDGCINFQEFCAAMRKAEDVGMSGMHACSHCTTSTSTTAAVTGAGSTAASSASYSTQRELNACYVLTANELTVASAYCMTKCSVSSCCTCQSHCAESLVLML
jgi:EF hand